MILFGVHLLVIRQRLFLFIYTSLLQPNESLDPLWNKLELYLFSNIDAQRTCHNIVDDIMMLHILVMQFPEYSIGTD